MAWSEGALMTVTDRAYASLRSEILTGVRTPGVRLREDELAVEFGISRTPIREALQRLDIEGLVEHLPHRGARVCEWSREDLGETFELRPRWKVSGLAVRPLAPQLPTSRGCEHCARRWNRPSNPVGRATSMP